MITSKACKIIVLGGAGLVGQNLVARLVERGYLNITVLDKHDENLRILNSVHPSIHTELLDLAAPGDWQNLLMDADVVVMLQAQIGGLRLEDFVRNNIQSTRLILDALKKNKATHLIHISSSVVESVADDYYSQTKRDQEKLVMESGIACPILRPTLMFGWFDRKHLGWLSRFMKKISIFPIPGNGRYIRQPLYVGDFCNVIIRCIENHSLVGVFNISGHERIDYIDMIRLIKKSIKSSTLIVKIPYHLFYALLWVWALFDKNPPFTTQQLAALVARDEFDVTDWPEYFDVAYTPFEQAIDETFNDPRYSHVALKF